MPEEEVVEPLDHFEEPVNQIQEEKIYQEPVHDFKEQFEPIYPFEEKRTTVVSGGTICPFCYESNPPKVSFCIHCGTRLRD
jgi:hypothetical protein